jgi:hypothetical protein
MDWTWLIKWANPYNVIYQLQTGWVNLTGLDLDQINFSESASALRIAIALTVCFLIKLLFIWFGRDKYYRADSGHFIYGQYQRGFWGGLLMSLPYLMLLIPLSLILVAIADPFLIKTREEKVYIETRIRADAKDISGSMTSQFKNSGVSKSIVAMNAHLEFLKMRAGKGDRATLWVFGSEAHLIQNFIVDDAVYYMQAHDAPWGTSNPYSGTDADGQYYYGCHPTFRYPCYNNDTGGTVLANVLKAISIQFDEDDKKQKSSPYYKSNVGRAVVIISDAAVSDLADVIKYLQEFKSRNIVTYLIWINETEGASSPEQGNVDSLLSAVEKNGGKYFNVGDEVGFTRAYLEIDKLEKVKFEIRKIEFKVPLFQTFILLAILSLLVIIPLGLLIVSFTYP